MGNSLTKAQFETTFSGVERLNDGILTQELFDTLVAINRKSAGIRMIRVIGKVVLREFVNESKEDIIIDEVIKLPKHLPNMSKSNIELNWRQGLIPQIGEISCSNPKKNEIKFKITLPAEESTLVVSSYESYIVRFGLIEDDPLDFIIEELTSDASSSIEDGPQFLPMFTNTPQIYGSTYENLVKVITKTGLKFNDELKTGKIGIIQYFFLVKDNPS
uniref:Uncharacterized protein n=1 Tax=Pithovirus LCPAC401 TaxID=2506595 RepID=A0A481Z9I9_9VIRU|nr:MAG: hypothetical protein LCPAC401_01860 [Pithovirus LCPAC401]